MTTSQSQVNSQPCDGPREDPLSRKGISVSLPRQLCTICLSRYPLTPSRQIFRLYRRMRLAVPIPQEAQQCHSKRRYEAEKEEDVVGLELMAKSVVSVT